MIRVGRRTALLVFLAACSGKSAPVEPSRSDPQQLLPPESAAVVAIPSAAPQEDPVNATSAPEPTIQPAPAMTEVPGRGSCGRDEDCVLSRYQEGCCTQGCVDYATNERDLAARKAKENCAAHKGPCPPPAPCRPPTHRMIAAKCSAGACVAVGEPIE